MTNITTVIVARNEERNIARAIRSVRKLGEVIVADTGSKDRTREIARRLGAAVHKIEWKGYGPSKREACRLAKAEYLLSIDADEAVSQQLAREISEAAASNGTVDGYFLPRVTNFCGSWIFHSGWYPEHVLRLFKKSAGSFTDDILHESVICKGKKARLNGRFLHYSYPDIKSYSVKLDSYARLGAMKYRAGGGKLAALKILVSPPVSFIRKFIVKFGFADGMAGLWIAALTAVGQFLKYKYALTRGEK